MREDVWNGLLANWRAKVIVKIKSRLHDANTNFKSAEECSRMAQFMLYAVCFCYVFALSSSLSRQAADMRSQLVFSRRMNCEFTLHRRNEWLALGILQKDWMNDLNCSLRCPLVTNASANGPDLSFYVENGILTGYAGDMELLPAFNPVSRAIELLNHDVLLDKPETRYTKLFALLHENRSISFVPFQHGEPWQHTLAVQSWAPGVLTLAIPDSNMTHPQIDITWRVYGDCTIPSTAVTNETLSQ